MTTGLLLIASVTLWYILVFGRGPISRGVGPHTVFATVMSVLSVLNAWRVQPPVSIKSDRANGAPADS